MSDPMFLTLNEVVERYRGQISEGTLRKLAFDEDRSIVHQDRQSHSLSVEGARSLGSQKPSRLPTVTIAPFGGSGGVTCARSGS
jgi:hypothetical protein